MIWDVTRIMTGKLRDVIVESNDENGGSGVAPRAPVGDSQRMFVTNGKKERRGALLKSDVESHGRRRHRGRNIRQVLSLERIDSLAARSSAVRKRSWGLARTGKEPDHETRHNQRVAECAHFCCVWRERL